MKNLAPIIVVNAFFLVIALLPGVALSNSMASTLHFGVAALNVVLLTSVLGSISSSCILMAWGCCAVELCQSLIASRSASWEDLGFDLLGLIVGAAISFLGSETQPARRAAQPEFGFPTSADPQF